MKVLLSGGGTGGHLNPGIALYLEWKRQGADCRYVLRDIDSRYSMCQQIDPEDKIEIHIQGISRKISLRTPIHLLKLAAAFLQVFKKIRRFRPDLILITGGYVSNPVAMSARILGIPLFIAEQNSVAGTTNRYYSKFARKVYTSFPQAAKLRCRHTLFTGNPTIFKKDSSLSEAKQFFDISSFKKVIGISGGSQGAGVINDSILEILPLLKKDKIAVLWSLGAVEFDRLKDNGTVDKLQQDYPFVKAFRFIDKMNHFFTASDLVITRSGATTISELILFEKPSLLIPIYRSPDDHQLLNARYLEERHCALILEEPSLNSEAIWESIQIIFKEKAEMLANIKKLIMPEPAAVIVKDIRDQL